MSAVQLAFYAIALGGSSYFLTRCRTFDFFSVGFASALVYFLPGFFGFVRSSRDFSLPEPILAETYLVFILVLAAIVAGAFVFDQFVPRQPSAETRAVPLTMTTETAAIIAALGLLATIVTTGDALFSMSKADVVEGTGRWHVLFRFAAIYLLVLAALRRQALPGLAGLGFLLFDLFVGFRVGIVIGGLAAATVALHQRGAQSLLAAERRALVLGVVAVGILFVYKRVYFLVKLGLWDLVAERLTDPTVLSLALLTSEPFGTQSILNEVIRMDFTTGPGHLATLTSLLVPFSNVLGAEIVSYNSLFQQQLFGGVVEGGMANNIWAQMYSVGGWLGIGIGVWVFTGLLAWGSWLLHTKRGAVLAFVALAFTFIAFYIHRNDIAFTLTLLRRSLMIWVVIVLPGMLLVDIHRTQRADDRATARTLSS